LSPLGKVLRNPRVNVVTFNKKGIMGKFGPLWGPRTPPYLERMVLKTFFPKIKATNWPHKKGKTWSNPEMGSNVLRR